MIKIGFTGTQQGMSNLQKAVIRHLIGNVLKNRISEVHHGDCIGADSDFHTISKEFNLYISIHPPKNSTKRAFRKADFIFEVDEYLQRNKSIVESTDILIATPKESKEILRSGTWSTIRYAKKNKKTTIIIYPNGKVDGIQYSNS